MLKENVFWVKCWGGKPGWRRIWKSYHRKIGIFNTKQTKLRYNKTFCEEDLCNRVDLKIKVICNFLQRCYWIVFLPFFFSLHIAFSH